MRVSDLVVEVRDKTFARKGTIPPERLNLKLRTLVNDVGEWSLILPAEDPMHDTLATPGAGIVVTNLAGYVLLSGPVNKIEYSGDKDDPTGTTTFSGMSDDHVLWDYVAYPQPSNTNPATQTLSHDTRTGKTETVMYGFVNANIGPSAPSARKKTGLSMGTDGARGPTITKSARFTVLGDLLAELALGGALGFRVRQSGSGLLFETFALTDRSSTIRLDILNGTLTSHKTVIQAPSATQVIVAGQGELVDRTFYQANTPASLAAETDWGRRIERYVDQRQTNDSNEYAEKAAEILADEGFTAVNVQAVPRDDETMVYGTDWFMGDKVAVVVNDTEQTAYVTGFALVANKDQVTFGALLGDHTEWTDADHATNMIRQTARRVDYLERADYASGADIVTALDGAVKGGSTTVNPDSGGHFSISHGFGKTPVAASVQSKTAGSFGGHTIAITSMSSSSINCVAYYNNAPEANSIGIYWMVIG